MTPTSIGPYRVAGSLGEGAYGAVYDATREETGLRVALKLLLGSKSLEPEVQNRFVREIALLRRLDHENIVRHYDCGLHNGDIYCAMELVDCGTLKDVLLTRGNLPWREAAEVAAQVCRALDHAHKHGCVHRDLKPANLYLSSDGNVKLGDLGLARDLGDSRLTTQGQTVGTWRYMAPEQIMGEAEIDGRLDLYALGCILFEMIAGRVPFDGQGFAEIFDQHLEATADRIDLLMPGVPKELADLLAELLEKLPEDRPTDARQVQDRLVAILADESQKSEIADQDDVSQTSPQDPAPPANLTQRLQSAPLAEARTVNPKALKTVLLIAAALVIIATIVSYAWSS